MGITAYGFPNFEQPAAQQLARELDIRSIGVQAMVTNFAPPSLTVPQLKAWFAVDTENGSSPCLRYVTARNAFNIAMIASKGIRTAGAEPWIYLKTGDGKPCARTAAEGHCFPMAGTPKADAQGKWTWWSTLFVGVFSVLRRLDPALRYVHVWNEPNAHFWMDKLPDGTRLNGTHYADFYASVASALVSAFPETLHPSTGIPDPKTGILVAGPVTYSPPFQMTAGRIVEDTWRGWFEPLLRATAQNPKLLRWVDFHAYDGPGVNAGTCTKPNCRNADAATIELNLQEIQIVAEALSRPGLQSAITESNFALEKASDELNWAARYAQRGVKLVNQNMALLRAPGQVLTRQLFDWGVPVGSPNFYRFLPPNVSADPFTPEMEIYRAFANFSGGLRLGGSGWTEPASASGLQVEGVCLEEFKPPCPRKPCPPPRCGRLKIALANGPQGTRATVGLRIRFCEPSGPGTTVTVDGTTPGARRGSIECSNTSQPLALPAGGLVVVECHCLVQ